MTEQGSTYDRLKMLDRRFWLSNAVWISAGIVGATVPEVYIPMTIATAAAAAVSGINGFRGNEIHLKVNHLKSVFRRFQEDSLVDKPKDLTKFICDYLDQRPEES